MTGGEDFSQSRQSGGWTGCRMTASIASIARSALWHLIDYWATATKR